MVERERETIVTTDGGRRGGGGTILAIVLLILVLAGLYLLYQNGVFGGGTETIKADINIDAPSGGGSGS